MKTARFVLKIVAASLAAQASRRSPLSSTELGRTLSPPCSLWSPVGGALGSRREGTLEMALLRPAPASQGRL